MDYVYHSHMDLMLEALSYLTVKTGDSSFESTFSRLELLCPQEDIQRQLIERIDLIRSLSKSVDTQYSLNQKELAPFFTPFSIGQGSIALMLVMSFYDPEIMDWDHQQKHISEEFKAFASSALQPLGKLYVANLMDDSNDENQKPENRSLIEQLEETGLKDEEKWSILRAVQNADAMLHQLTQLLLPIKELIAANLFSVTPLLDDFRKRWSAYFEKNAFSAYLSQSIGMEPGDIEAHTLHIYPLLFNCAAIVMNMDEESKSIYLRVGACLPEGLNVKSMPIENNQMLEGLKALSDKSKLSILDHIRNNRSYGQALAKETGLSTATISHHMSALINCGFIRMDRVENRIYYQMDKESVNRFLKQLSYYLLEGDSSGKTHL